MGNWISFIWLFGLHTKVYFYALQFIHIVWAICSEMHAIHKFRKQSEFSVAGIFKRFGTRNVKKNVFNLSHLHHTVRFYENVV